MPFFGLYLMKKCSERSASAASGAFYKLNKFLKIQMFGVYAVA